MRRRGLTEAEENRLAEECNAHLTRIHGTGRPWLTRLAQPAPEWFDQYAERKANDGEWFKRLEGIGAQPFTDAEALAIVRQDRRYAAGLKFRVEDHLVKISHAIKPGELAASQRFFHDLDDALGPGRGTPSEFDRAQIRRLRDGRRQKLIELQAEYRRTGEMPPVEVLPIFDREVKEEDGTTSLVRVSIERDDDWPTLANWAYLEALLAPANRRTLEGRIAAPRPRRPRKTRRRR
jgi:hypothetical protein